MSSTDHGRTGTIHVETIYKGACGATTLVFSAEPFEVPEHDAILFLHPDGAMRWRLTLTGPGYGGLSPFEEQNVIQSIHATPSLADAKPADLAVFRDAHGKPWGPAVGAATEAAARIFDRVAWVGATEAEVTSTLGPPDEVTPQHGLRYSRHDGEGGVIRTLRITDHRVVAVDVSETQ